MYKLTCFTVLCLLSLSAFAKPPAKASQVPPPPTADDKKPAFDRIPVKAARDLDYAMISMGYIATAVVAKKQKELQDEIAKAQQEDRDRVRVIENLYGIKMFDEKWNRCCDTLDPLTGIITRGGFKSAQMSK